MVLYGMGHLWLVLPTTPAWKAVQTCRLAHRHCLNFLPITEAKLCNRMKCWQVSIIQKMLELYVAEGKALPSVLFIQVTYNFKKYVHLLAFSETLCVLTLNRWITRAKTIRTVLFLRTAICWWTWVCLNG